MTPEDIYDACRVALGPIQRRSYMPWRDNDTRWYSDERLRRSIKEQRHEVKYRSKDDLWLVRVDRDDVFDLQTALEILLVGVTMATKPLISSLDQLGVHWQRSPKDDYPFAFGLLDRPEVFDPIRETGIPLADAREVLARFEADTLRLMWHAGMSGTEIVAAARASQGPDVEMLQVLAGLRRSAPQ